MAGPGRGFVDVFTTNGLFVKRLAPRGVLNAPWGLAQAPAGFGSFGGDLLVGNFGNGRINAFNPITGRFAGSMYSAPGKPISIDGLWGLHFGTATTGGTNTLLFSSGPNSEATLGVSSANCGVNGPAGYSACQPSRAPARAPTRPRAPSVRYPVATWCGLPA